LGNSTSSLLDSQLQDLSQEAYEFLMQLSLINHLPTDIVERFERGRELLMQVMGKTALVSYDVHTSVYRIHYLLLDYLHARAGELAEAKRREALHIAAQWCIENNYTLEALGYLEKLGDYAAIVAQVNEMGFEIDYHEASYIAQILEQVPPEVRDQTPFLRMLYTRVLMSLGDLARSREVVDRYIVEMEARELTQVEARELCGLYINLGFHGILSCTESRDYNFAHFFERASHWYEISGQMLRDQTVSAKIMPYACLIGHKDKGEPKAYINEVLKLVPFVSHILGGCLYGSEALTIAEVAFYRGEIGEAEKWAMSAHNKAKERGQDEIEFRALFYLMRIHLYHGRLARVVQVIDELDDLRGRSKSFDRSVLYEIILSWLYATLGEKDEIAGWVTSDFIIGEDEAYTMGLSDMAKMRYYLMSKEFGALASLIASRSGSSGLRRYLFGQIDVLVYEAVAAYHMKDPARAVSILEQAYELSAPNSLDMPFIELGNEMRTLASAATKQPGCKLPLVWLESIRSKAATYAKRLAAVRKDYTLQFGHEDELSLTVREKELLFDVAQGLSRTEIAMSRNLSANTVKAALKLIFEKLGAANTVDAVRIAAVRGLLPYN